MEHAPQHTECKETWCDVDLRWVCGFADAQGGRLYADRLSESDAHLLTSHRVVTKNTDGPHLADVGLIMVWDKIQAC